VSRGRKRFNAVSVQFDLIRCDINPFITSYCTYAFDAGRRAMIGGGRTMKHMLLQYEKSPQP
jgi:hypothetical protein